MLLYGQLVPALRENSRMEMGCVLFLCLADGLQLVSSAWKSACDCAMVIQKDCFSCDVSPGQE